MRENINLLQNNQTEQVPLSKNTLFFRIVAFSCLFIVSFFSIILFILIALSPLPALQQREKEEVEKLKVHHATMGKMILTKERLVQIDTLIKERPLYADIIQSFQNRIPGNVVIDSVKIRGKQITVKLSSVSLEQLDSFMASILQSNVTDKKFRSIILNNIYFEGELQRYAMVMEFNQV